ncbi:MAG: hypothetical protein ACTSU2_00280 [Promethearchaeota archaeon]
MAKKHCDKHKRYVYNCPDCRRANGEDILRFDDDDGAVQRRYIDVNPDEIDDENKDEEFEIPIRRDGERGSERRSGWGRSRGSGGAGSTGSPGSGKIPTRFQYGGPTGNKRKYQIVGLAILAFIILIIIWVYAWPSWHARIFLQEQLYYNKAGKLPFWEYLILNYWSSSFIINKVGLIGGILGSLIMSLPPEKELIAALGTKFGWGRPSKKKALIFWWTIGFGVFYFIGQIIDASSYFSLTMYMAENGAISISPAVIFLPFKVLLNINALQLKEVYVYSNIFLPIISYILGILALRIILEIVGVTYLRRDDYLTTSFFMFLIADFFAMHFVSIPTGMYDGLSIITLWASPIGLIGFIVLGVYLRILKKSSHKRFKIRQSHKKRIGVSVFILLFLMVIPAIFSIPIAIGINQNYDSWYKYRWSIQINKERDWTYHTSGLNIFKTRPISNLSSSKVVDDFDVVQAIRQYDKESAFYQMNSYVQSSYESMADSDIVYIKGKEYWVAAKTIKSSHISGNNVYEHTNMFDHVEGILAMDTFSGTLISDPTIFQNIFGVNLSYPIFFGEHESSSLTQTSSWFDWGDNSSDYIDYGGSYSAYGAYDDDILLNTGWNATETNYLYSYNGEPDGSLTGLEAFWFTNQMGLFSYAINSSFPKEFLINRNILTRVNSILLPGLWTDNDPYLVFDSDAHKVYYAVSICTGLPVGSYARTPILRFLGVALVDVRTGEIEFVLNPKINEMNADNDYTYDLWKIYLQKYPWHSVNEDKYKNWLKSQMRYPEELFEEQLAADYIFHVNDPSTWYSGSQFYARPEGQDLFYVTFDIGDGLEFVGIDLAQRKGYNSHTLAGMYVLRHGIHIGEAIFYDAISPGEPSLIGPTTARSSFEAAATQQLTLIQGRDYGNTLLYPLGGSLYYFIPVYSTSGQGNYQNLKLAGFVDAFNVQKVGFGADANKAYDSLNLTKHEEEQPGNVSIQYSTDESKLPDYALMNIGVNVQDYNFSHPARHIVVNISVQTDIVNITKFNNPLPYSTFTWGSGNTGMNFTAIDKNLLPGEGYSVTINMTFNIGNLYMAAFKYQLVLIVDGVIYEQPEEIMIIYNT